MNELATLEKPRYPWYQLGQFQTLEQGDFIPNCPVILPENHYEILSYLSHGKAVEAQMVGNYVDLIIMSQSCDLENNKINQVLLCGYYSALKLSKNDLPEIKKERRPSLHLLEKCESKILEFEKQVVDFRTIYTLPKEFVIAFATTQKIRARLLSPYKEHLSQAFARYFMRVGLPRPLIDE
jgi:hypothetical protein